MATNRSLGAGAARILLPGLLLLSGFCGISYEILYTKLLGNVLGNQFIINGTVLLTFLLGIGLGTLYAHRLRRFLWAVEAGIGVYAACFVVFYGTIENLLYSWLPGLGTNILVCAAASFILLVVPAFLIGCSIPLFAAYLGSLRSTRVFSRTYAIYNVGAATTALTMEFVLLRELGLRSTTLVLAGLNVVVAAGIIGLLRFTPLAPMKPPERLRFPLNTVAALMLASVASAIFQLMMIKVAEFIFGPYNETFSLVLAIVLLGLSAGSFAAGRFGLTFRGALLLAIGGILWLLATLSTSITVFATLYPVASDRYLTLVLLKLSMVVAWMALPAIGFGATIPALLRSHRDVARESGQLLFYSSVANAGGFLLMAFVLHRLLDYGPLLIVIAGLTGLALFIHGGVRRRAAWAGLVLVVLAVGVRYRTWDEMLLYVGHTNFHELEELQEERESRVYADRFKGPQDVFAITWKDGSPYFFINGYISIPLSAPTEKLVGALSSMLAPRLDRALVLGVGTGATAGTVGLAFEHTDAVEINEVVLQNLHRMSEYNFDIEQRPQVSIVHDDGIRFVRTTDRTYSLILNTVTTPLYFSSSKLYTREFLEQVSNRLEPDGIYVTWIDWRIGDEGFDIIVETLRSIFPHSWMTYMDSNYFILFCSNEEIALRQFDSVATHPELSEYFRHEYELPARLLPYAIISLDTYALAPNRRAPINTLDHPALEYQMARLQDNARLTDFKVRLERELNLEEVRATLSPPMDWQPGEFLAYADVQISYKSKLSRLLARDLPRRFDDVSSAYRDASIVLADEVGTANGYYEFGKNLLRRRHQEAAIETLRKALAIDPKRNNVNYYLGLAHAAANEFENAREHLLAEWERDRDPRVPLAVGKVLIRLNRLDEALEWLADARPTREREQADILFYRGVAYETLGNITAARDNYSEALSVNSKYRRAQEALDRLDNPSGNSAR